MSQPGRGEALREGSHGFDVVIRGYDRIQVDELVDRLGKELGVLQSDRDACAGRAEDLNKRLADAQAETEALSRTAPAAGEPSFQSMGARIASLLKLAEEEAADIRRTALEAVEVAETQSRSRMANAMEDLDRSLKSRKAEAARIEQERDQTSRHEASTRLEQARAEAEKLIIAAETRVAELEAQRVEVDAWLTQLRQALATVPAPDRTVGNGQSTESSSPATPSGDTGSEPDDVRRDGTILAREDILEYRHMRRKMR